LPTNGPPVTLRIAYSGGRDSHVLLHWLAGQRAALAPHWLRAVHVEHGLHPDCARWAEHCTQVCAALQVPLDVRRVDARAQRGQSAEAAARAARYAALAADMQDGDLLLTAHHQDDQAETVLLALLRGGGLAGAAAMPGRRRFGPGWLLRPLLDWPAARLARYAHTHALQWVEDPSNGDARFDRNFLRGQILPLIGRRWPAAQAGLARHAAHAAEAQGLLDELAAADGATADTLAVTQLAALPAARQRNLLRGWLRVHGVPAPSWARLETLRHQALTAGADRLPYLPLGEHAVRIWQGRLHLTPEPLPAAPAGPVQWRLDAPLDLPGIGRLQAQVGAGIGIAAALLGEPAMVEVRFRSDAGGGKALKKRLQALAVPPWERGRLPLLFRGAQLLQVAGQAPRTHARAVDGQPGYCIAWQPAKD
ncbi:MAG TPA: tRNA lysidine(34) synthetase TilS, partial [Immundisolibacter sp.]|nr:tRNA lysidine(34) synthetase TilS [Immundisolibacter sp.]